MKGKRILLLFLVLLLLGLMIWGGLIGMICWKENHVPAPENYDAIIVLGAQVKMDGTLSLQLTWRMDAALEAWQAHPCPVVVCGGQGVNEPGPEGEYMRDYLLEKGVPAEQILAETSSTNTRENLEHARELLDGGGAKTVLIVTSRYHLPRAMAMASDLGLQAEGIGSPIKPEYWLKNYGREAIAWVKYWAEKYMGLRF